MRNRLDSRTILELYELIHEKGEPVEGGHRLGGITAFLDHDGYSVYLSADEVTLHLGFHNTYDLNYADERHAEQFENRMRELIRTYLQPGEPPPHH